MSANKIDLPSGASLPTAVVVQSYGGTSDHGPFSWGPNGAVARQASTLGLAGALPSKCRVNSPTLAPEGIVRESPEMASAAPLVPTPEGNGGSGVAGARRAPPPPSPKRAPRVAPARAGGGTTPPVCPLPPPGPAPAGGCPPPPR